MADDTILFRERPVGPRTWAAFLALCALGLLALRLRLGTLDVMALMIVVVVAVPFGLMLWSINRYGAIVVTPDELRIGRDRLALSTVEPGSIRLPGEPEPAGGRGKIAGGGYAAPLGQRAVGATVRGRGPVRFATRDPEGLARALRTATTR